jgi:hypothetical protein
MEKHKNKENVSDNAKKELRISDVIGSDNDTRFYIPTDKKKTNDLMVVLKNTLHLTEHEFYHEDTGKKETQFVTGTLDKKISFLR